MKNAERGNYNCFKRWKTNIWDNDMPLSFSKLCMPQIILNIYKYTKRIVAYLGMIA